MRRGPSGVRTGSPTSELGKPGSVSWQTGFRAHWSLQLPALLALLVAPNPFLFIPAELSADHTLCTRLRATQPLPCGLIPATSQVTSVPVIPAAASPESRSRKTAQVAAPSPFLHLACLASS